MLIHFRFTDHGTFLVFNGTSFGYGQGGVLNVIHRAGTYLVLHKPSTKDWAGRGDTQTHPASYTLVRIDGNMVVEVILEIEPGPKWKAARQQLIEIANAKELTQKD